MIGINTLTGAMAWEKLETGGGYAYSIGLSPNKGLLAYSTLKANNDFIIR